MIKKKDELFKCRQLDCNTLVVEIEKSIKLEEIFLSIFHLRPVYEFLILSAFLDPGFKTA